jgi:phosphatidylserine decarboxylase
MRIAPEGIPFIVFFAALTVAAFAGKFMFGQRWAAFSVAASILMFALLLFMVFFFRDPDRSVPDEAGYIAPADGRVIMIEPVDDDRFLNRRVKMISIFMSPINVHINRAPCAGTVRLVEHRPGSFKAAYHREAPWKNESTSMLLECESGETLLVRQVAGALARRTVCRVGEGARLERGQRYGMIKFSSRVDVYLPEDVEFRVKAGDRVYAGETVIASRGEG